MTLLISICPLSVKLSEPSFLLCPRNFKSFSGFKYRCPLNSHFLKKYTHTKKAIPRCSYADSMVFLSFVLRTTYLLPLVSSSSVKKYIQHSLPYSRRYIGSAPFSFSSFLFLFLVKCPSFL